MSPLDALQFLNSSIPKIPIFIHAIGQNNSLISCLQFEITQFYDHFNLKYVKSYLSY